MRKRETITPIVNANVLHPPQENDIHDMLNSVRNIARLALHPGKAISDFLGDLSVAAGTVDAGLGYQNIDDASVQK